MGASLISLFPEAKNTAKNVINGIRMPIEAGAALSEMTDRIMAHGKEMATGSFEGGMLSKRLFMPWIDDRTDHAFSGLLKICQDSTNVFLNLARGPVSYTFEKFRKDRLADIEFIDFISNEPPVQDWETDYQKKDILLDLPGMRLIDMSIHGTHKIENYSIVFAPRAGHHSNIAEKTAIYLRDHGLSKMAVVEQKCAADIPMYIDGKRHYEDFESQVEQFKTILEFLKNKAGFPSHLIAICQPGPLLITTLILYPELGKTFGSAGSPMHTEGERGMLTDFSRMAGENYIDYLIDLFSGIIPEGQIGAGRKIYDGRLQVMGFYYLGMDQHMKNFRKYYTDLKYGNNESAQRQRDFYQWYNWTHHFPAGFIRDTYKKIFVNNDLIHGRMKIGNKTVGIRDYPGNVPIWSLGGSKDDIVPPKQANGHLDEIESVPEKNKLSLLAKAGHMGLFRSSKVLKNDYSKVVRFLLKHSDKKK
ncbi:MAG: DUF3141 domain-containing protein [Deltaproteobacteria bacterium]|nr:DUF3141 domain-containing protein [Deltaproteobacteria bacterium]